jgi:triosephosphate isomerase
MVKIGLIAQNFEIFEGDGQDKFARTGEISANHILKAGAQGVILGHSEVGDTPEIIHKKLKYILEEKICLKKLVILIGESWDEFDNNSPKEIASLMRQKCKIVFEGIPIDFLKDLIVGYEPKWGSRGSGRDDMPPPHLELISACISEIRNFFEQKYNNDVKVYFIYGGRSTPERTKQILADKNIDGLILGSACNSLKKTMDIANTMNNVCGGREKVLVCNFKAYELPDSYEKYADELSKLSQEYIILLSPPYTDIRNLRKILEEKGLLLK